MNIGPNKRNKVFDKNRNLKMSELEQQLIAQVQALQAQLNEQSGRINSINQTQFSLTADQVIRNFNEIPPFSGEDSFKLKSFLKTVEDVESLCGANNIPLKQYCLKKVINTKIIGKAKTTILEIPEHRRNWTTVCETLMVRFRPKQTIHNLLFQAKEIKVSSFKDLFCKLSNIKSECTEICDYDDEEAFTYESIDRELVQILKLKLIPILQIQIENSKSLFELDNQFCQSEIYYSDEVIKPEFRLSKFNSNSRKPISKYRNESNNNYHSNYNNNHKTNYQNLTNKNKYNNNTYSNQFRNNHNNNYKTNQNFNRINQYNRNYSNSGQYRHNNRDNEQMEVDNVNEEVNFTDLPRTTNFQ